MTIRQRVLAHIQALPGQSYTNRQLAEQLGIPEPSVRRATLQLEDSKRIKVVPQNGPMNDPLRWVAIQIEGTPAASQATGFAISE